MSIGIMSLVLLSNSSIHSCRGEFEPRIKTQSLWILSRQSEFLYRDSVDAEYLGSKLRERQLDLVRLDRRVERKVLDDHSFPTGILKNESIEAHDIWDLGGS